MAQQKTNRSRPSSPPIHTMQDDLAAAPSPSRFELRHKRPLPRSKKMEDLRQPTNPDNDNLLLPLPPKKGKNTLSSPLAPKNPFTSPLFLWPLGIILTVTFLSIVIAIIASL